MWKKIKPYINLDSVIACIVLAALAIYGFFHVTPYASLVYQILLVVTIVGSLPLLWDIINSIIKRRFGVDLIAIAAISTSLFIGQAVAAAIILLMLSGGESLEHFAQGRARSTLEKLLRRAPTVAHLLKNNSLHDMPVQQVAVGDVMVVKQHEIVPIDGLVITGESAVDESTITGEPLPRDVSAGDRVWSGSVNSGNILQIQATALYEHSTFSAIIRLVKEAEEKKAPAVRLADRYSVVFTVVTFGIAGVAAVINPTLAAAVLVVATPCPLILAAPIAFIAGMSRAAKKGIIVKHGGVFESLLKAKAFFFDKTGTLTFGIPVMEKILVHAQGYSEKELLERAVSIEQFSTHILAQSLVKKAKKEKMTLQYPADAKETVGHGMTGMIDGKRYSIGKPTFMQSLNIAIAPEIEKIDADVRAEGGTIVHIAEEERIIGSITFSDQIRKNTPEVLHTIEKERKGVEMVLVTGDNRTRAREIGQALGFDHIESEALPEQKVELVRSYEKNNKPVVMIGDGVNDAPALGAASAGIALGSHGATASTDTADAIIMVDDIGKILDLVTISQKTMLIAKQSVFVGMGLSLAAMIVAFFGYLPPVYGALLQEGIDVIVILNALRALN